MDIMDISRIADLLRATIDATDTQLRTAAERQLDTVRARVLIRDC